jgi:hypothetical protein
MASVRKRAWTAPSGETKTAWVVDYSDSRGDRQRKHFPTKKAADAFRINIEGQLQSGIYRPGAGKLMLKQVCESFLKHCEGRHQRDTLSKRQATAISSRWLSLKDHGAVAPCHCCDIRTWNTMAVRSCDPLPTRLRNCAS